MACRLRQSSKVSSLLLPQLLLLLQQRQLSGAFLMDKTGTRRQTFRYLHLQAAVQWPTTLSQILLEEASSQPVVTTLITLHLHPTEPSRTIIALAVFSMWSVPTSKPGYALSMLIGGETVSSTRMTSSISFAHSIFDSQRSCAMRCLVRLSATATRCPSKTLRSGAQCTHPA